MKPASSGEISKASPETNAVNSEEYVETAKATAFEAAIIAAAIVEGLPPAPEPLPIVAPVIIAAILTAPASGDQTISDEAANAAATAAAGAKTGPSAAVPTSAPEAPETDPLDQSDTASNKAGTRAIPVTSVAPKSGTDRSATGDRNNPETQLANVDKPAAKRNAGAAAESVEDRAPKESNDVKVDEPVIVVGHAAAPATDSKRLNSESLPINNRTQTTEVRDATENNNNATPAEPADPTIAPVAQANQQAHDQADAPKPNEAANQTLGAQVSEAAQGAKPPADAVQAILQANERTLGAAAPVMPTATRASLEAAVPIAGLAVEIAARAQAGSNRFEIRLDPPELGRIDVRLDVDRNGQVTSRLTVDRVETLEHLRRDSADLERALQQAGLKTGENSLQFTLRDQSFARRDEGTTPPDVSRVIVPDPELAPIDTLPNGYGRLHRAGGGIDIRV